MAGQFLQSILDDQDSYRVHPTTVFDVEEDEEFQDNSHLKPIDILKQELLPTVLPCVNELLKIIKQDKEYEREKLNSLNWMVEFLYRNNPRHKAQRQDMELLDIPFVQKILAKRPQAPLPLHLRLTKGEAATLIQAGVRGYMARQDVHVQSFREKIKKKQSAAIIIQSAWRGHKVRAAITDTDLCDRDVCNLYYGKKSAVEEEGEGEEVETPAQ